MATLLSTVLAGFSFRRSGVNPSGLAEQPIPSVTTGVDDLASGLENAVREAIVSEMQP
jgi:hypothetical protein